MSKPDTRGDAAEAADLHDALAALADAGPVTLAEQHRLRQDVVHASIALDLKRPLEPPPRSRRKTAAQVVYDLNDELYTVTTIADHVAATIPHGDRHDDAVAIYEAGTRATADVVRLKDLMDGGPEVSEAPARLDRRQWKRRRSDG